MSPIDPVIWSVLMRATRVARTLNINEISLEDSPRGKMIRGFDATHGAPVFINHVFEPDELDLPFSALAIHDCDSFVNKTKLAESRDESYKAYIDINSNTMNVDTIKFSGKKFKLEFSAGKPETVRAPKKVNDTTAHTFKIEPRDITALNQSVRAMGGEDVTLVSDGSTVFFEVKIKSKEIFSMELSTELTSVNPANKSFVFTYPFKTFYPLVSNCEECSFNITSRGILNCKIDGINAFAIPRIM